MDPWGTPRPHVRRLGLGSGPLARVSDRVECLSRLLFSGFVLLAVPVALAVGSVSWADTAQLAREQAATRTEVPAVLVEDATGAARSETDALPGEAGARWTSPDGRAREDTVRTRRSATAGDTVGVWVDEQGSQVPEPLGTADVATVALVSGLLTLVLGACAAICGHLAVRWLLDRHRTRAWEREWAAVEPVWAGRA